MAGDRTEFSVSPTTRELPQVSSPAVRQTAPEQLIATGEAVQRAGGQAAKIYENQLREANKLRVDQALIEASDRAIEYTFGDDGYTKLQGRAALERPDGKSLAEEYGETYSLDLSNMEKGLGNDAQRKAFRAAASGMSADFRNRISQHTAREFEVDKQNTFKAGVANAQNTLMLYATDPDKTAEGVARIEALASEEAGRLGLNAEARAELVRSLASPGHSGAIQSLLDEGLTEEADAYFTEHPRNMDGVAQLKAYSLIRDGVDIKVGNAAGDAALAGLYGQQQAGEERDLLPPVSGPIGHKFGETRGARSHKGIDITIPTGTPVHAPGSGVARVKNDPGGYGQYVEIVHDDGRTVTRMAHLSGVDIADGARVSAGMLIGKSGGRKGAPGAGNSSGDHLHYEVRVDGKAVDPRGSYKVKGATGGGGDIASAIAAINADPSLNDRQREFAKNRLKEGYSLNKQAEADRDEKARDAAYDWLYKHPGGNLPPGLYNALDKSDVPSLVSFGNSMRERAEGIEPSEAVSLRTYAMVREAIADGRIKRTEDVLRYAPQMTRADTKSLINDVTSTARGDKTTIDSLKNTDTAFNMMKEELAGKGMDPKSEEFGAFRGRAYREIAREERRLGRPLTGDEMRPVVLGLIADATVSGGFFGRGKAKPVYKVTYADIPPTERAKIVSSLRKRLGRQDIPQGLVVQEFARYSMAQTK